MKILFAVKIGSEDWQEELITDNELVIPMAKLWAKKNGFNRIRVADIDMNSKPDFIGSINKQGGTNRHA